MLSQNDIVGSMIIITLIGIAPLLFMTLTSFTKIVVVLTLVRNALGVQQVPPTMVINGLALVLTMYILAPTGIAVMEGMKESSTSSITQRAVDVIYAGKEPFKAFLLKHAGSRERQFFVHSATNLWPKEQVDRLKSDDLIVLAPAFVVTELTEAFRIGFLLYLAFVMVDLVIANVLVALGLQQASPTNIAIPFKLLLFVMLDGWSVLLDGLVSTYK